MLLSINTDMLTLQKKNTHVKPTHVVVKFMSLYDICNSFRVLRMILHLLLYSKYLNTIFIIQSKYLLPYTQYIIYIFSIKTVKIAQILIATK